MRTKLLSSIVLLAATATAYPASFSRFIVELGGNNHAAAWKQGQRMMFTPGTRESGRVYRVGDVITWDVVLECGGVHEQPGSPSHDHPIWGAANIVHNIEIRQGTTTGPLATEAVFFSSINDGTAGDPLAHAAFAASYNVGGNGPGRLIDKYTAGGPRVEPIFTYPTASPGKLIGHGAGYKEWVRTGEWQRVTTPGIGMELLPDGSSGLGKVPITEGQIDTSNMSPGTYVLRVIPANGNNGLRGDRDLYQDQPAFAVAMNQVFGDHITFTLVPEPTMALMLALGVLCLGRRR